MEMTDPEDKLWPVVEFANRYYTDEAAVMWRISNADEPSDDPEYEAFIERDRLFMEELVRRFRLIVSECLDAQRESMLKPSGN